jgi:hypothetical protein
MVTKAVHLELVTALTTEAFLATLKRFISRRGRAAHLYSDNATNFVGAERELKEQFASLQREDDVVNYTSDLGVTWHFIPPHAPNFGGLWEISMKSVKGHLAKIMRDTIYTYEECSTLLCQIEAVLNSRPLTPMSEDPNDLMPLTPAHFLIGGPVDAYPETSLLNIRDSRLSRWQLIEKQRQDFWNRWTKEYLNHLQQRSKWKEDRPNIRLGDLVLLPAENAPPMLWPAARVTEVHPGKDGKIRVVTVKTAKSEFKRSVRNIYQFPVNGSSCKVEEA